MSETQILGPCTECGTPRDACTAPDYCCDECLHFPPDWDGYAPTQRAEPTGDMREALMKWLSAKVGGMCFEEAPWQAWGDEADELLALPAVRDALAAQETVRRVSEEVDTWGEADCRRVIDEALAALADSIHAAATEDTPSQWTER